MTYDQAPATSPRERSPAAPDTSQDAAVQTSNSARIADTPLTPPPAGDPDLLGQQLAFDAQDYRLEHYTPSTGLGCFDAAYDPVEGQMDVTLRLAFDFAPADQSSLWTKAKDWLGIDDGWTAEARADAIQTFVVQNQKIWSDRYRFQCVRPGWERYQAQAHVHLEIANDPNDAHYTVRLAQAPPEDGLGPVEELSKEDRGYVDGDVLRMHRGQLGYTEVKGTLAEADMARLQARLPPQPIPLCITDQGEFSPTARGVVVLDRTSAALRDTMPSTWKSGLFAAGRGPTGTSPSRCLEAGQVVATWLQADGLPCGVEPSVNPTPATRIEVTLGIDPNADPGANRSPLPDPYFNRAGHEVGHLFGLNDEYDQGRAGTPEQIADQMEEDKRLAAQSGTRAPPAPATTPSILSTGPDVLPFHYSTFHEALSTMTRRTLHPSDWQIEEVPRPLAVRAEASEDGASW